MVKQTYQFISDRLKAMKLFEKVFAYAELIDTASGSFPAFYKGEGNYIPINLSSYAGVAYLRKLEPMRFEKSQRDLLVGCEIIDVCILPIRAIISVKKELVYCDNVFGSEFLTEELFRTISGRFPALAECASVNDAEVIIRKSESDRLMILEQEYSGSKLSIPYDWLIISMDFDVRLEFNKGCLAKFCSGYDEESIIDCEPPIPPAPSLKCASFIKIKTKAGIYEYTNSLFEFVNEFGLVTLDGQGLSASSYAIIGNKITLSNSEDAINRDNMDIIIQIK